MNRRSFLKGLAGAVAAVAATQVVPVVATAAPQTTMSAGCGCNNLVQVKRQCRVQRELREKAYRMTRTPIKNTLYAKDARIYAYAKQYQYGARPFELVAFGDRPALMFNSPECAFAFAARENTGNEHMFVEGRYIVGRKSHWVK